MLKYKFQPRPGPTKSETLEVRPAKQHAFPGLSGGTLGPTRRPPLGCTANPFREFLKLQLPGLDPRPGKTRSRIGGRGVVLSSLSVSDVENHRSHLFLLQLLFLFFMMLARGETGRKLQQSFEESRLSFWGLGVGGPYNYEAV